MRAVIRVVALVLFLVGGAAAADRDRSPLQIYFFYSDICPHCHHQMGLMRAIADNNTDLTVHFVEVSKQQDFWHDFLEQHGVKYTGVPRTFIGERNFVGYADSIVALNYSKPMQGYLGNRAQIVKAIEQELGHRISLGADDPAATAGQRLRLLFFWPLLIPVVFGVLCLLMKNSFRRRFGTRVRLGVGAALLIVSLFLLLGTIPEAVIQSSAQRLPYPLFVVVIALVDGFNPCAFTVLIILLSLLTYTKSRRDMLLIGATFIVTSGVMYFLFIMILVLVGHFFLQRYGHLVMLVLGAGITIAGALNIKDYFFLNRGFSLSLSDDQKTRFTKRAAAVVRGLGSGGRIWVALGGTVVLAVFVNLVELGCTAILPAVYLTTLVSRYDGVIAYAGWTALYAAVYVVPLLAILLNFLYVFKSVRLSEKQGRVLKLLAGVFMLFFGLLMIFRPELLSFG